jgi:hypothetical protein
MSNKRKVGPMRPKTKDAMLRLAEIMVANYKLEVIKGTPEFLEYAIHEAEENNLEVSWQTIKLREQFLEMRCDELYKEQKSKQAFEQAVEESGEYDVFEDEEFYWACGDMVDHDSIIRKGLELMKLKMDYYDKLDGSHLDEFFTDENIEKVKQEIEIERQQSMSQQIGNLVVKATPAPTPVKNYTIFIESEDGLRVVRGSYKGLYVSEIDRKQWIGCAIGWSKKMLKDNETLGANRPGALTEDDKNVFLDIISGKDV